MTQRPFDVARNLGLVYALALAREFTPMLAVWVVYLTDFRHLTLTQVAVMEAVFWFVKLALEVPSGAFADHFGRRATFLTGIGLEATGTLLFAFAGDFSLLFVSYVLWSGGLAFRSGNDEAFLYDSLVAGGREHEYTHRVAIYWALGTGSLLTGGLIGGVLAQVTNLQVAIFASLVPFGLALPVILSMQEPPWRADDAVRLGLRETVTTGLREVWRNPPLRAMVWLEVALMGVLPAFTILAQPFLDRHDVPLALFGVLLVPVHLARTFGALSSARMARRFGLPAALTSATAMAVAGLAVMGAVDHVGAFAGMALAMGGLGLAMPAIGAYINQRTESRVRATVLSVAPMGTSITMAVMSAAGGVVADRSLQLAFGAMAIVIAASAGAALLAWLAAEEPPATSIEPVEA